MKKIGRTDKGGILLECSGQEFAAFCALWESLEGFSHFPLSELRTTLNTDFEEAFQAIRVWVTELYHINDMQKGIDQLKDALGVNGEQKGDDSE
jgi:hypothetical protein